MRPRLLTRILLRNYPSTWRARYSDELAELIEEARLTPRVGLDVAAAGFSQRLRVMRLALNGGRVVTIGPAWRHPTAFAVVGALLLLPTFLFVSFSLLGYELGLDTFRGAIEAASGAMARYRIVDLLLVMAPPLAFVAALAPLLRVGIERHDGALEAVVAVRARLLNVMVGGVALLLAGLLVWHIVVESVLQVGA